MYFFRPALALARNPTAARQKIHYRIFQEFSFELSSIAGLGQQVKAALAHLHPPLLQHCKTETDRQSEKYLFHLPGKGNIEAVLLQHQTGRKTLCVSTQVGCGVGCVFCATGRLGLKANLCADEILLQVFHAQKILRQRGERLTNVVFMGMGEPFHNYQAVIDALQVLADDSCFSLSRRRVTVSTAGIPQRIRDFACDAPGFSLAVSVHAARDDIRNQLVPLNRRFPLQELVSALKDYWEITGGLTVMLEFTLVAGVNDSPELAQAAAALFAGLPVHVNLIPSNDTLYPPSDDPQVRAFAQVFRDHQIAVTVRHRLGDGIAAACGQLAASHKV